MPTPLDILNQLTFAVIVVNRLGKIQLINQAAESLLGHGSDFVLQHAFNDFFEEVPLASTLLSSVLDTHQSVILRELQLHTPNQTRARRVNIALTPLDSDEVLLEVEHVDRILQISKEDQIYQSQNASNALLRALAHEIRNPLGGIRGAAQLLERELNSMEQKEYTDVIISEADRLRKLVDRLLGPSKRIAKSSVNIHEVIEHVLKLSNLDERSNQIGLQIKRFYDPSLPELQGERDHLLQAVLNIVTNALDALEDTPSPELVVRTNVVRHFTIGKYINPQCVGVEIQNNGPMIPTELQSQIFLPLITSKSSGSGLGLAIAQNVIQAHGGLISCESEPCLYAVSAVFTY